MSHSNVTLSPAHSVSSVFESSPGSVQDLAPEKVTGNHLSFINESYDEIVRLTSKPSQVRKIPAQQDHVLIIKAKDTSRSPNSIKTQLVQNIKPQRLGVNILQVRPTRAKELLVRCKGEEQLVTLKKAILENSDLKEHLDLRIPRLPRVSFIVFGVPQDTTSEELQIAFQELLSSGEKNFVFPREPRSRTDGTCNWLVEVSREQAQLLKDLKRVYIGFASCFFREFHKVTRCYHCQAFGHLSLICKNPPACAKCGKGHLTQECSESIANCVNCTHSNASAGTKYETSHQASSSQCPLYRQEILRLSNTQK
ncbi:uncharacterized protein LOC118186712 [Stegodyphus dumicola]|uniref:uncharacterized protein LOC118186712 n=2 Tax=Stegodyphus dumicola TaxID=202533 RepID=UPI0015AF225F|nr:uncharacterized protein LOC118186712 [Stegodyphus dumicola]